MNWKNLLESVSESLNDHLQLRHDYLVAENRILRNQIDGRVQLTESERQELAKIGQHLGYTISDQTVGNILKRHRIPPAPERKKTVTWGEFVRPHMVVLLATDFFNSRVWSWFGLMISYLLWLLYFCGRQVRFVGPVLHHPIQGLRSFGLRCRDVRPHVHHGIHRGKQRFPAMSYGDAVLRIPVSVLASSEKGRIQSQDRGKVLCLLAAHPRPIREGPMQRGQPLNELLQADDCEAA